MRFLPDQMPLDLEIVATDVPAFGCWRAPMRAAARVPDRVDDGTEISTDDVAVRANDDGTLDVRLGDREHHGLFGIEDLGDRGDSYDFDPVHGDGPVTVTGHRSVMRTIHESGIRSLRIARTVALPAGLDEACARRTPETAPCELVLEAVAVPGVPWVAITVTFENAVRDHRLRLRFPTGARDHRASRRHHLRSDDTLDEPARRLGVGAPPAGDVPAPGVDRGERAGRRRPGTPRGGGDR